MDVLYINIKSEDGHEGVVIFISKLHITATYVDVLKPLKRIVVFFPFLFLFNFLFCSRDGYKAVTDPDPVSYNSFEAVSN